MEDLIKALQILARYEKPNYPTHCEHDVLWVLIDPGLVRSADIVALEELGFWMCTENNCFKSFKYGSA